MHQAIRSYFHAKDQPSEEELMLFKKTQKYCKLLTWIPGLRMIAICNSLSLYAGDTGSDIDLFIVSDPKRMWLVRIIITAVFQVLGVRRYAQYVEGRFCLSFFATTEALDFSKIAIENDLYLQSWIGHLRPIIDIGNTYDQFLQENAHWTNEIMPDTKKFLIQSLPKKQEWFPRIWNVLDGVLKTIFLPITLRSYKKWGCHWGTLITPSMLKFHSNDQRVAIRDTLLSKKQ